MATKQTPAKVREEKNKRGILETISDGDHLTLTELRIRLSLKHNRYIFTYIPSYPRPELNVFYLSHSTDLTGLKGIWKDEGFKDPSGKVVWFSLTVKRRDLDKAEDRDMRIFHPDPLCREEDIEPGNKTRGFLQKFASSPAFKSSSRYGSYRFTFSLKEVLKNYRQQFCAGQKPEMRIWKTVLFKQEVMYVVLVHRPSNQKRFSYLPLLPINENSAKYTNNLKLEDSGSSLKHPSPDPVCEFRDDPQQPHFVWRPQAMCGTHSFQLVKNPDDNLKIQDAPKVDNNGSQYDKFYVWDHVAIALEVDGGVFEFDELKLRESLRFCERGNPSLAEFQTYEEAKMEVNQLWPSEGLEKFNESEFHIAR